MYVIPRNNKPISQYNCVCSCGMHECTCKANIIYSEKWLLIFRYLYYLYRVEIVFTLIRGNLAEGQEAQMNLNKATDRLKSFGAHLCFFGLRSPKQLRRFAALKIEEGVEQTEAFFLYY